MRTAEKIVTAALAAVLVAGLAVPAAAAAVRGRDLLTPEEWRAHHAEMQVAKTPAERQAVHQKMQQLLETRAAAQDDVLMHDARPTPRFAATPRVHPGWGPMWVR